MNRITFLNTLNHGQMPGLTDEILAAAFVAIAVMIGWFVISKK